nr:T9SS type A sorting domain-containing protein [Ignavibacteria bacterium]
GSNNLVVKPNYKQLGITAFNFYTNGLAGASDPANFHETYNNLQGIRANGTLWINPITNQPTLFPYSGNPETGSGWNMTDPGDRRFLQCSGPITVVPNDTQSIVVGQIITRGDNNLKSVTALKGLSLSAQRIFDNNFQIPSSPPTPTTSVYAPGNARIYISWADNAEKTSIPNKLSGGTYRFQGYNIYAIRNGTNGTDPTDRILINTFDVQDGIGDIKDSIFVEAYGTYVYTIVQKGTDQGISRYIVIDRDYINNVLIVSGTPYKFAVTAYFYDSTASLNSNLTAKVTETPISNASFTVIPQTVSPGIVVNNNVGDTLYTNQRDLGAMPIVLDPLSLVTANYKATYGGTPTVPNWTLTKTANGTTSTLVTNSTDFTGKQDTAYAVDGFLTVFQLVKDSGVIVDPANGILDTSGKNFQTRETAWTYSPSGGEWFTGPDTTAIAAGAKVIQTRQFQSRSLGMSFPTTNQFNNRKSRIAAHGVSLQRVTPTSPILTGGPLRKIKVVFGVTSKAYRYIPTDTNINSTPIASTVIPGASNYVDIPFSAYFADELDSTGGALRQLNVGFVDYDSSGTWNPNTSALGGYEFTYFFASVYDPTENINYTNKNPSIGSPTTGFLSLDVMYAWLPRVKSSNGVPMTWMTGDTLTVTPYRLTKNQFLPGAAPGEVFPISYSWTVDGTVYSNTAQASNQMTKIKAYPNPYFGGQVLETDPFDRFINFSHLPSKCNIYIYALNGVLVRTIQRNNTDPNNSIERWDMLNSNEIPVASGMYIVYIDAGSIGTTILKIAVFTPAERIQTF